MRARTVSETMQKPFTNNTRNDVIRGSYPLSRSQYECADKKKKRKKRKRPIKK